MADKKDAEEQVKQSIVQRAKTWGGKLNIVQLFLHCLNLTP